MTGNWRSPSPKPSRRPWARRRARLGGYFWTPCPLCGEWFGGNEWRGADAIECGVEPTVGHGICSAHQPGRYVQSPDGLLRPELEPTARSQPWYPLGFCGVRDCGPSRRTAEIEEIVDRVLERLRSVGPDG